MATLAELLKKESQEAIQPLTSAGTVDRYIEAQKRHRHLKNLKGAGTKAFQELRDLEQYGNLK